MGMQVKGPAAVLRVAGRFALEDNGETPDTQDALFEYPRSHRSSPAARRRSGIGARAFWILWHERLDEYRTQRLEVQSGYEDRSGETPFPFSPDHSAGGPKRRTPHPSPGRSPTKWRASSQSSSICTRATFWTASNRAERPIADVEQGTRSPQPAIWPTSRCHREEDPLESETERSSATRKPRKWLERTYRKPWDDVLRSFHL